MGRDNIPTRLETNIPLFPDFRRKARGERETCRKAVSWMSIYNKRSQHQLSLVQLYRGYIRISLQSEIFLVGWKVGNPFLTDGRADE